jgi:hypothetical protein
MPVRVCCLTHIGMEDRELYVETICAVVEYFGSYQTLASVLNVRVEDLSNWSQGKDRPPTHIFLKIVDFARSENIQIHGYAQHLGG